MSTEMKEKIMTKEELNRYFEEYSRYKKDNLNLITANNELLLEALAILNEESGDLKGMTAGDIKEIVEGTLCVFREQIRNMLLTK